MNIYQEPTMRQIICWMLGTEMNKAQFLPLGKVQVSGGGKYTSHCNRCYRDEMRSTGKLKKKFFFSYMFILK